MTAAMNKPQEPNPDEAPLRRFARDSLRSRLAVAGLILLLLVLLLVQQMLQLLLTRWLQLLKKQNLLLIGRKN